MRPLVDAEANAGAKRGPRFRAVGAMLMLVAAMLVLSGCWGRVYFFSEGSRNLTVYEGISKRMIWDCTARFGIPGRAFCGLDTVEALCEAIPIDHMSAANCREVSGYSGWEKMNESMEEIAAGRGECLSFRWWPGQPGLTHWTAVRRGSTFCG
jgi:hypothetical protein